MFQMFHVKHLPGESAAVHVSRETPRTSTSCPQARSMLRAKNLTRSSPDRSIDRPNRLTQLTQRSSP